jgi:glutamate-ammonia-ligase adenylyltransferase
LSDVEWTLQLLQLEHGATVLGLRTPSTLDGLAAAVDADLISADDAIKLKDAWVLASRIRSALTLWTVRSNDVLPTDVKDLEGVARLLDYPRGSASLLEETYLSTTRRARGVVERIFYKN